MRQRLARTILRKAFSEPLDEAIGTPAIRVRGVVVVGVAGCVDIPCVVRIATIGRPQPTVLGFQPTPHESLEVCVTLYIR